MFAARAAQAGFRRAPVAAQPRSIGAII